MTVKGGTSQACAACKYQRRKCSDKCALAPYFPADDPQRFQNAHRLFGVSNMMKILNQVSDDQKRAAMDTIIYESNVRQRDPIHGCHGIVRDLYEQLERHTDALYRLNARIHILRQRQNNNINLQFFSMPLHCSSFSQLQQAQQPSQSLRPLNCSPSATLKQPTMMESRNNNVPGHPYQQQYHYHAPFVGTSVGPSNQLLINETKGSHVQVDKKIPKLLRGQADVHKINAWKNH